MKNNIKYKREKQEQFDHNLGSGYIYSAIKNNTEILCLMGEKKAYKPIGGKETLQQLIQETKEDITYYWKKIEKPPEFDELPIVINFTFNQWGTYEMGEGENFNKKLNIEADFFIYTEKSKDTYFTTFIPNPIHKKNTEGWESEENIKLFNEEITYKTTIHDIKNNLRNIKGFRPISRNSVFNITDFDFYYAGLMGNKVYQTTKLTKHPKYKELITLLIKNKKIK